MRDVDRTLFDVSPTDHSPGPFPIGPPRAGCHEMVTGISRAISQEKRTDSCLPEVIQQIASAMGKGLPGLVHDASDLRKLQHCGCTRSDRALQLARCRGVMAREGRADGGDAWRGVCKYKQFSWRPLRTHSHLIQAYRGSGARVLPPRPRQPCACLATQAPCTGGRGH